MVIVSALLSLADNVLALDTVAVFGILAPNSLGQKELTSSLFCRRVPSGFRPCGLST